MQLEQHLAGLRAAVHAIAESATAAGLEAAVPTTPDWDVRRVVVHQGLIHRWARGQLLGQEVDLDAIDREGMRAPDPVGWLRQGAERLAQVIGDKPEGPDAPGFVAAGPPPRRFWARRQCHETTLHAVDALSAVLGRYPTAADTWINRALALDGIDELLSDLLPRPRSHLRSDEPLTIAVLPDDADQRWLVALSRQQPVTVRGLGDEDADVVLRGPAVALYLTLWNRSDEVSDKRLELWAEDAHVTWG
jgi:uncharacterized protein (TIGR03083 family)